MSESRYYYVEYKNPFDPTKDRIAEERDNSDTLTIKKILDQIENSSPIVCMVNGDPLLRENWDRVIEDGDLVCVAHLPLGGGEKKHKKDFGQVLLGVGLLALGGGLVGLGIGGSGFITKTLSLGGAFTSYGLGFIATGLFTPRVPSTQQDTTVSRNYLSAQGNTARLGEAIPVVYGRQRVYPDFASTPYSQFRAVGDDNFQYLHHHMVVSQGTVEFDRDDIRIGDTPISGYEEIEYQRVAPESNFDVANFSGRAIFTTPQNPTQVSQLSFTNGFRISFQDDPIHRVYFKITVPPNGGLASTATGGDLPSSLRNRQVDPRQEPRFRVEYRDVAVGGVGPSTWTKIAGTGIGSDVTLVPSTSNLRPSEISIVEERTLYFDIPEPTGMNIIYGDYEVRIAMFYPTLSITRLDLFDNVYMLRGVLGYDYATWTAPTITWRPIEFTSNERANYYFLDGFGRTDIGVGTPFIFPVNRVASRDVTGVTLDIPPDGDASHNLVGEWSGPYRVGSIATTFSRFSLDFVVSRARNNDGDSTRAMIEVQAKSITSNMWENLDLTGGESIKITNPVRTDLRPNSGRPMTYNITIETAPFDPDSDGVRFRYVGEYEIRVRFNKTGHADQEDNAQISWVGLKGILQQNRLSNRSYQNDTLLLVRMRVTTNLSEVKSRRINVIATRSLERYDGTRWLPHDTTQSDSISWVASDILRNPLYGAGITDDNRIDADDLLALHNDIYPTTSNYTSRFNAVFDKRMNTWEALNHVANAGRCVPVFQSGRFYLIRDRNQPIPVSMFNRNNIIKDSFSVSYTLANEDTINRIILQYQDADRDWAMNEVYINDMGVQINDVEDGLAMGEEAKVATLTLFGCTSRSQAVREAGYYARNNRYRRRGYTIKTELNGQIPTYGDKVLLSHDVIQAGFSGEVSNVTVSGTTITLTSNEPFTFGTNNMIRFMDSDGSLSSAYTVTAGANDNQVLITNPNFTFTTTDGYVDVSDTVSTPNDSFRLSFGAGRDRTNFVFYTMGSTAQECIVRSVKPNAEYEATVSLINEDSRIHTETTVILDDLGR